MSVTIGYLRVSTQDQDLEKNKADILRLANEKGLGHVAWVVEKASGTKDWRERKVGNVLLAMSAGDSLIVSELSRLGRSTLQILEIMKTAKEKGVAVYAVKGGWSLNGSMESKIVLHMLAMVSEIERDLISERTKEALRAKKAAGIKLGRPKGPGKSKLDKYREEIIALLQTGSRQNYIAKRYGVTPASLSNWIKRRGIDRKPVEGSPILTISQTDAPPLPEKGGEGKNPPTKTISKIVGGREEKP
jgi:DNA invertase Pin-like site-specific DNA recombinase